MAAPRSPNTPSSIPSQSKKGVFSSGNSSRRPSTSSVSNYQIPQGIGYSPGLTNTPTTPAGSGIPAFRALRSLLPFGPNKNATPISTSVSPNTSRSPFANFGSVRKSMTKERERKTSLSNDAFSSPVIAIERGLVVDDTAIRRSVSLSRLEKPLPSEPAFEGTSDPFRDGVTLLSAFTLRTPSPGPPLSAELSTIIEADSSGVSKNLPSNTTPDTSRPSSPPLNRDLLLPQHLQRQASNSSSSNAPNDILRTDSDFDADTSALDLSTSHLADQVRSAMLESDSSQNSAKQWRNASKDAVIIDADEHPDVGDTTFNLDTADPELLALLSPNTVSKSGSSPSLVRDTEQSPTTPTFPSSPASRLPRARQASSFLPRLRPSNSPSPSPTARNFSMHTPSPTTATAAAAAGTPRSSPLKGKTPMIAVNGSDLSPSSPPRSPVLSTASTSTPVASRKGPSLSRPNRMFSPSTSGSGSSSASRTKIFGGRSDEADDQTANPSSNTNTSRLPNRTLRQVMLGVSTSRTNGDNSKGNSPPSPSRSATLARTSLDMRRPPVSAAAAGGSEIGLGRPSLEMRRGGSFDSRIQRSASGGDGGGGSSRTSGIYISRSSTSPERSRSDLTAMTRTRTTPEADMEASTTAGSSPEAPFDEPYYRHRPSFDSSSRPSFDSSSGHPRPASAARLRGEREHQRAPSLRVTDTTGNVSVSPIPRGPPPPNRTRKRSMSVQERLGKGRFPGSGAGSVVASESMSRPGSSLSVNTGGRASRGGFVADPGDNSGNPGPKMEWLGPRTAKAFRAAGLLDFEREREKERADGNDSLDRHRDRSGSVGSGVLAPSPLGVNGTGGALINRFASLRSTSEYNPTPSRSHSRMAFSEAGSGGRRGSESFSPYGGGSAYGSISTYGQPGLMESPTFTVSSGSRDRDTPKSSTSTAPTSVSESFGYLGRDRESRDREREREREEIRDLRDKHGTEMGALLGALSDSQRTARVLREENSELRERLDRLAGVAHENAEMRQACGIFQHENNELRRECEDLRRELVSARSFRSPGGLGASWGGSSASSGSGFRTPTQRQGHSSPLAIDVTPRYDEEVFNDTVIIHDSIDDRHISHNPQRLSIDDSADIEPLENSRPASSSTPSIKRRLSNGSSIFPIPPSNMTMLLHDEVTSQSGNRSSADHSQYRMSLPPSTAKAIPTPRPRSHSRSQSASHSSPETYRGHQLNKSIASGVSISPTTANFSMVTGSPGSLFLRPEHEMLLGDMESLDLGARGPELEFDSGRAQGDDEW